MLIPCPVCGLRDHGEFVYGGDATRVRPALVSDDRERWAAYVYDRSSGGWLQKLYVKASNTDPSDNFGSSVSISGTTFAAGAFYEAGAGTGINNTVPGQGDNTASASGAVYVFR